jgi:rusticyanin
LVIVAFMTEHLLARAAGLLLVIVAVVAACTAGRSAISPSPSLAAGAGRCRPAAPMRGNMDSPDAQLGQLIGREAGTRLAGDAPIVVAGARIGALGNQVPAGATVDTCLNRLTFTTSVDSMVIEAVPAANPDMTFRIAGLVDPTVVVPLNAQVRIEYVNADTDEAHAFVITGSAPPFAFRPVALPAFPGAAAGPIGDPTAAGHGARDVAFTAGAAGVYHYLCPMPGHAEMGMYGNFVVG